MSAGITAMREWASLLRAEGGEERRPQQKEERHARAEPIARNWHVTNPCRVRARNARWFAASRNEAVRFDMRHVAAASNTAKVHFNQHSEGQGRFGPRLIYGGH